MDDRVLGHDLRPHVREFSPGSWHGLHRRERGVILKTTNSGVNWVPLASGTGMYLYGVHFPLDAQTGYVVGDYGTILKTTDGGANWAVQTTGSPYILLSVQFPGNVQTGYATGYDWQTNTGVILRTTNSGISWERRPSGVQQYLWSVHFPVDARTGYASGYSGIILRTTDLGGTWTGQSSHAMHNLYSICFPLNVQTGYVVGSGGAILKTTDGGASFVEQEEEVRGQRSGFRLSSAPNPFSGMTVIRYQLPTPGPVRLAVYDVAGQLVKVLTTETKPAGVYEVAWNGRGVAGWPLPSGVYLIRLEAGLYREIRKAVLLR